MKKLGLALLLVVCWVATASAARVYLNDGSWINARQVWRDQGKVVVLVNRDIITSYSTSEVNLKKTFPPRKKRVKRVTVAAPAPAPPAVSAPPAPAQPQKGGKQLSLPALRTKLPEREPPKLGGEEGAIRKQKKEMQQRLNE
ncbi:MAG: hypothetical protein WBI04_12420 [Trichlorobacter sp.]